MGSWIDAVVFEFTRVTRGACDVVPTQKVTSSAPRLFRSRRLQVFARHWSSETENGLKLGGRVTCLISCARATRGRGLPSLDARSGRSSRSTFRKRKTTSLERMGRDGLVVLLLAEQGSDGA
jgi:hypothetical protein